MRTAGVAVDPPWTGSRTAAKRRCVSSFDTTVRFEIGQYDRGSSLSRSGFLSSGVMKADLNTSTSRHRAVEKLRKKWSDQVGNEFQLRGRKCISGAALVRQTMDGGGNDVDSDVSEVGQR